MYKSFVLILLAVVFIIGGSIIAHQGTFFQAQAQEQENKYTYPTGERATLGGGRIYLMYDLETGALCYVTSLGGISCTHRGNLAMSDRIGKITKKAREEYVARHKTAPNMIVIDIEPPEPKPLGNTEPKKDKDL